MSQQYVKNTNKPDADSYLWSLGNNWRISTKTNDVYCPLKFDQQKEISNLELFTKMMGVLNGPIEQLDYATIAGFFFLPVKTDKGDPLLFAYTDEAAVKKKLENIKKYAGQSSQQTTTTVPKPTSTAATQQSIEVSAPKPEPEPRPGYMNISNEQYITTYTDPNWIEGGSDEARELESRGYSYIPSSLATTTGRIETIYDKDEEGKEIEVGHRTLYLMGRIINVKIADR